MLPILGQATPPVDLAPTGTTIAGFVATAATAGLGIMAAIYGLKVMIRAFKTAAK